MSHEGNQITSKSQLPMKRTSSQRLDTFDGDDIEQVLEQPRNYVKVSLTKRRRLDNDQQNQ